MCGFGDKDHRPIDGPPILEIIITNQKGEIVDG